MEFAFMEVRVVALWGSVQQTLDQAAVFYP